MKRRDKEWWEVKLNSPTRLGHRTGRYVLFVGKSLAAQTGAGWYGLVLGFREKGGDNNAIFLTRGEARRLSRALMDASETLP